MIIEAWDRNDCSDEEIDAVDQSILLSTTDRRKMFENNGTNGIGIFKFSYQVFNLTNTCEEGFTDVPPCVFNLTNTYQEDLNCTDVPSLDNSICDSGSMIESTPPWLWIVVAIVITLFNTLHFIVSIVLACVVRQKNKELKLLMNQQSNTSDANSKNISVCIIYSESKCESHIVHVYMNEYSLE